MKKLLEKMYARILMKTGERTWIDDKISRFAHYILYPEFRTRSYDKYLKWCAYGLLSIFIVTFAVEHMDLRIKLFNCNVELREAYNKVDFLVDNAEDQVYQRVLDSFLVSDDYLRYMMYKETGIIVPDKVSQRHLQTMVDVSSDKKVPLKIYLRVIQRESGFDSTAVNSSSGAFGFCQMMPGTFNHLYKSLDLDGGKTPANNLTVGAELLSRGYKYWKSKNRTDQDAWEMALACYAMGDSLPRKLGRVPDAVRGYVDAVLYKKNKQ